MKASTLIQLWNLLNNIFNFISKAKQMFFTLQLGIPLYLTSKPEFGYSLSWVRLILFKSEVDLGGIYKT